MSDVSDIKAELLVLKAENAELRRERDFYFQQVTEMSLEIERGKRELGVEVDG